MTEPTDDELDAVIAEYRTRIYPQDMHPRFERAIMRDAIAKWGAPQPVACEPLTDSQAQAGAVPMSHEAAKALVLKYGIDPLHLVLQVERAHGIKGGQHVTD